MEEDSPVSLSKINDEEIPISLLKIDDQPQQPQQLQQQSVIIGSNPLIMDSPPVMIDSPVNLTKIVSKVELRFKCFGLKDMDTFSKSDPQIFVNQIKGSTKQLVGSTEKIDNNLNPIFKKAVTIEYHFEQIQTLNFMVLDIDTGENDIIGDFTTTLGSIVSQPGKKIITEIKHKGKTTGRIEIIAEEIQETGHNIVLKLIGSKLDKKDLFTSDPYYKIFKTSPTNGNLLVYQSPVIKNTLNPVYNPVYLKLEELNGGDMYRDLVFEFWDYDMVGSHDFIGSFRTTTDEILRGQVREFPLINPKKQSKSSYRNSGIISFGQARFSAPPSFLDYISSGCEINLIIAIDCTASNLSPSSKSSLHYNTPTHESQYAKSIMAVGSVLAPYDSDGKIGVLGFGAEKSGMTSHCFQFGSKAEARGVEGVLEMYNKEMANISLSGPTNFAEIIKHARKASKGISQKKQKYTILLILTDGEICDMDETIGQIQRASEDSPLSIVIVGLGNANFDNMNTLDGDEEILKDPSTGKLVERDIVQFVAFRDFPDIEALQNEVLKEIPQQLTSFMNSKGFVPN